MLIEYVHPSHMPSIDDAKSPQVTPEVSVHNIFFGTANYLIAFTMA